MPEGDIMLRFSCPSCRTVLQVEPRHAGSAVTCSRCRQLLRVPAAAPQAIPVPPAPPPEVGRVSRPVPTAQESRPTPERLPIRKSRRPAFIWLVLAMLTIAGGAGGSYYFFHAILSDSQAGRTVTVAARPEKL